VRPALSHAAIASIHKNVDIEATAAADRIQAAVKTVIAGRSLRLRPSQASSICPDMIMARATTRT